MNRYLKYILYDQFSQQKDVTLQDENHFTSMHPGPMTNTEDLCDSDSGNHLYGTGKVKGLEEEFVDRYILLGK